MKIRKRRMRAVIEQIKKLLQDFIAPQIEALRGDIKALDARVIAESAAVRQLVAALEQLFDTRLSALEQKFDAEIAALKEIVKWRFDLTDQRSDLTDQKIGNVEDRFSQMNVLIEAFRRELAAEIRRVEETLSADFVRMESGVDTRLEAIKSDMDTRLTVMAEKLDLVRRELLAEIKVAKLQPT
jgi:hypothetical protein